MYTIDSEVDDKKYIKKSIFLTYAVRINNIEQVLFLLKEKKNNKATHNCWAYRIGENIKFFDDDEPYGTAGKQILNAILVCEFDFIFILVSRWFGGIKLGSNILSKTYFTCALDCLKKSQKSKILINEILNINLNISLLKNFLDWFKKNDVKILSKKFNSNKVFITIQIEKNKLSNFKKFTEQFNKKLLNILSSFN